MSKDKNKPFLRQKLILEHIIKLVKDRPNQETFFVDPNILQTIDPSLKDFNSLKIAFKKIIALSKENIIIELQESGSGITTATGDKVFESKIFIHIESKKAPIVEALEKLGSIRFKTNQKPAIEQGSDITDKVILNTIWGGYRELNPGI